MGYNRRTVNASTTPHICHQLGTKHARETLLCWFIVMIWVLVWDDIYRYEEMNVILDLSYALWGQWMSMTSLKWSVKNYRREIVNGALLPYRTVSLPPDCVTTIHRNPEGFCGVNTKDVTINHVLTMGPRPSFVLYFFQQCSLCGRRHSSAS